MGGDGEQPKSCSNCSDNEVRPVEVYVHCEGSTLSSIVRVEERPALSVASEQVFAYSECHGSAFYPRAAS